MVEILLRAGANIEACGKRGFTPLITACCFGRKTVAKRLLEEGAKIGAKDARGRAALSHAAANGLTSVVYLLLQNGTDIRAEDGMGRTALIWAGLGNDVGHIVAREILRRFEKGARDSSGSQKRRYP